MSSFFFYRHLKNEKLLNLISNTYTIQDAFILVNDYDMSNNIIKIYQSCDLNNKILKGKYVNFPFYSYNEILCKISEIEEIQIKNQKKYKVEKICIYFDLVNDLVNDLDLTKLTEKEKREAFIIY